MSTVNPFAEIGTIIKPNLVVFFVIDRSGSMSVDGKMNSVNNAMREAIPILRGIGGSDADVKIAVLTFSDGAEWMYNDLITVDEDFTWNDIIADGYTDFGSACNALYEKLSREEFLKSQAGNKPPVIILLSDGEPTDEDAWPKALQRLKTNKWFGISYKIALAVDSADEEVLAKFVGNPEGVYKIDNTQKLKKIIKEVAVKSVATVSKSRPIDSAVLTQNIDETAKTELYKDIKDSIDDMDNNLWTDSVDADDGDWE